MSAALVQSQTPSPAVVVTTGTVRGIALRAAWVAIKTVLILALSAGLFFFSASAFSQNNKFPVYYHPDESTKADQLLRNQRNFNHPQLMLEAAIWVLGQRGVDLESLQEQFSRGSTRMRQELVFAGRDTSAYLSAGAVVLLAWAGLFAAGWAGFTLAGIAAALCPALLAHSRYFKEEPSLCLGVAAVVCVAAAMCRRNHWSVQILLAPLMGAAVALAASGKYAGAAMIVPAALAIIMANFRRWWLIPICLVLLAYSGWDVWQRINWRAIEKWDDFVLAFESEKRHATTDHSGVTMDLPNDFFIRMMRDEVMPHVLWLSAAVPIGLLLMRRRAVHQRLEPFPEASSRRQRLHLPDPHTSRQPWIVKRFRFRREPILFPIWLGITIAIYTTAVSYSAIPFYRYILPATLLLYVFAALGIVWLTNLIDRPQWRQIVLAISIIVLASWQATRFRDYDRQFVVDSHELLADWINRTLPRGTLIVADTYTQLNGGLKNQTHASVIRRRWASDVGSVSDLRARGVKYVAVAGTSYERFLDPATKASPDSNENFAHHQRFYRELFDTCPVVWARNAEHPMHVFNNPDITVFRISASVARAPARDTRRPFWR